MITHSDYLKTIELRLQQYAVTKQLGDMSGVKFSAHCTYDVMTDHLVATLAAHVWSMDGRTLTVPAGWVQYFKHAHFPKWLLRKFPVKVNVYVARAVFPASNLNLPDEFGTAVVKFCPRMEVSAVHLDN